MAANTENSNLQKSDYLPQEKTEPEKTIKNDPLSQENCLSQSENSSKSNESIKCSYCQSKFSKESDLKNHMESVHFMKKCPVCNESIETKVKLEKHIESNHEGLKPFKCLKCNATFTRDKNLRDHNRRVHEGRKERTKARYS